MRHGRQLLSGKLILQLELHAFPAASCDEEVDIFSPVACP